MKTRPLKSELPLKNQREQNARLRREIQIAGRKPDSRSLIEYCEQERIALPGSLRSDFFSLNISPWLRFPMELTDKPGVRRLTVFGAVQSAKSTLGEIFIINRLATDPGNMLYNWEDDVKAQEIWNERIEQTIRQSPQIQHRLPDKKIKQRKLEMMFTDGMYFRMQGAKAKGNRQSKSVRYLVNEEVKDWEPGALTDMRNRVTASWNSFELNITPGGVKGDELDQLNQDSSQHVYAMRCPKCGKYHQPSTRVKKDQLGGLHRCDPKNEDELRAIKLDGGGWNFRAITELCYYECPHCGYRWKDKPAERAQMANEAIYECNNPGHPETDYSVRWHALFAPWIGFVQLLREFHAGQRAAKYGDLSLLQEYVQKREAEFWDPNRDEYSEEDKITLRENIKKTREGLADKDYRFATVDKQRGETKKGDVPHYWVVIRDWNAQASALVFEGRVNTDEELEDLLAEYEVDPIFVCMDSGDGMTMIDVYKLCGKNGWIAIKGEDRAYYRHPEELGGGRKVHSPEQKAFTTDSDGMQYPIPLIMYSKQGIRDLLHYCRESDDFDFQIPGDVSEDYQNHMSAEALVDHTIPKTGQVVKIWRQRKKRNDLFVCECYQAMMANLVGLVGVLPEERPAELKVESHRNRG